jgi:ABC-type multidrug transport system fused ATPase/permease subunit
MRLIVLLGEANSENGELTEIAKSRCDFAAKLLATPDYSDSRILPTGGFGSHFNKSRLPHGHLLTQYLVSAKNISSNKIEPYTNTYNTVEDALVARRVVIDKRYSKITVVTSSWHMQRTEFIFRRIFPNYQLDFQSSSETLCPEQLWARQSEEKERLRKLESGWVDIPLYEYGGKFPTEVYENASAERQYYDNIWVASYTGILVAFAFAYTADLNVGRWGEQLREFDNWFIHNLSHLMPTLPYVGVAAFVYLLNRIYTRAASLAHTARQVLYRLEIAYGSPGYSASYIRGLRSREPGFQVVRNYTLWIIYIVLILSAMAELVNSILSGKLTEFATLLDTIRIIASSC